MDELHEQTVNLLSFQELPKNVFDIQVAFNLVRALWTEIGIGAGSGVASESGNITGGLPAAQPNLRCRCCRRRFSTDTVFPFTWRWRSPSPSRIFPQALAGEHVIVCASPEDTPTSVSAAGQEDIMVALTSDANHKNGVWLWATTDNLRVAAVTAVECAETMTASRPRGQIQ